MPAIRKALAGSNTSWDEIPLAGTPAVLPGFRQAEDLTPEEIMEALAAGVQGSRAPANRKSIEETQSGLLATPCFTMRRRTLHGVLVTLRQLAGPLGHDHHIDLRMAQPNAAQVLMNRSEMDSKLRRHGRIGSAAGMSEKGFGYTAASGW